jgi:hypothetical protein|tara:strand:+ start:459 stop:737 length:279 start_codon:yes stop_codon:yes gene_type:complete
MNAQNKSEIGLIQVATVDYRGFTPEELADRAVDKIIQIGDQSHPVIRDQAVAFREHIRGILVFYMNEAVKFDRVTIAQKLKDSGHAELINLL